MHGYRSLEGTFLGGCIFSGRQAGPGSSGRYRLIPRSEEALDTGSATSRRRRAPICVVAPRQFFPRRCVCDSDSTQPLGSPAVYTMDLLLDFGNAPWS